MVGKCQASKMIEKCFRLFYFCVGWCIISSSNHSVLGFSAKPLESGASFVGRVSVLNSFCAAGIGAFLVGFLRKALVVCAFQRVGPFHLQY